MLRAKSLAVLRYLARNPNRLVTHDELLRAAWPGIHVSPTVLRVCVSEIRAALGKDAAARLGTVARCGYRFDVAPGHEATRRFVGRRPELGRLHEALGRSRAGCRQLVFVVGEAGSGKTALVDRFLDEVRVGGGVRVATGQCLELHGRPEPYAPILDLLHRACDEAGGEEVARTLSRWAPSWRTRLPGRRSIARADALRRHAPRGDRRRMLRELSCALGGLARKRPLVLALRDLHWSDPEKLDAVAHLAQHDVAAPLLVVASYRPGGSHRSAELVRDMQQRLHARGLCGEIRLGPLTAADVEAYLVHRLAPHAPGEGLARTILRCGGGHPLILVKMLEAPHELGRLAAMASTATHGASRASSKALILRPTAHRRITGGGL